MSAVALAWICTVVLASVLVTAYRVDALRGTPRSRWLSLSGGAAVAYVFLRLMPELTRAQEEITRLSSLSEWLRAHLLFVTALAGAVALFGIERAAKTTQSARAKQGVESRSAAWVFWLHTALFSPYVALIGYLLFRGEHHDLDGVAVLGLIMALHFAGTAVAFFEDYRSLYRSVGQWILAGAVIVGAAVGYMGELPRIGYDLLLGSVAGAVVFSVLKEEVPPAQQSTFWAFLVGVGVTAILLRVSS